MKRKKIKTILCHMAIITICAGVFCHGYINGISISRYDRIHIYAEADNWTSCDTSDLVTAFRYYCKSRNLALEGSVADALTSFTTSTFNNICSTLGIDPTELQAELKKTTAGNLGLRFLFSQTGITAYNRIFAEFLQNNDLAVGDSVDNEVISSGKSYTDLDGNFCYVYQVNKLNEWYSETGFVKGSTYRFTGEQLFNTYATSLNSTFSGVSNTITFHLSDAVPSYNLSCYVIGKNGGYGRVEQMVSKTSNTADGRLYDVMYQPNDGSKSVISSGNYGIVYEISTNKLAFCTVTHDLNGSANYRYYFYKHTYLNAEPSDYDITVDTPGDTVINNNTYNNNYVIIYNEGDTYVSDDNDEPLPTTPPGGGGGDNPGGGGDDPGGDPDNWNPTTPTVPGPTNPGFPTVDLPDIDIPNLPSLNFSLGDLRNKFPFSLPFDIIAVLNVLDGEPQAPHIQAAVPIGRWYTWEMDFDFSEFDNYARIFRAFEFIGFCIGLAIFTVHFVKG